MRFCGRVHVYMCVYIVWVCVCLYITTGESLHRLCSDGQRRERRQGFSPTVFIHTTSSLLTNLLSSRHSQDLNDPYAAESTGTRPIAKVCCTEEKVCSPFMRFVCVYVAPEKSPSALLLAISALLTHWGLPHTGFSFCFLWSHCSLYTHIHIHSQMHIHAQ